MSQESPEANTIERYRLHYLQKSLIAYVTINGKEVSVEVSYNDDLSEKMRPLFGGHNLNANSIIAFAQVMSTEMIQLRLAVGGKRILKRITEKLTFERIKDELMVPLTAASAQNFLEMCVAEVGEITKSVKRLSEKCIRSAENYNNYVTAAGPVDSLTFDPRPLIEATEVKLMRAIDNACTVAVFQGVEEALGGHTSWESVDFERYDDLMSRIKERLRGESVPNTSSRP